MLIADNVPDDMLVETVAYMVVSLDEALTERFGKDFSASNLYSLRNYLRSARWHAERILEND